MSDSQQLTIVVQAAQYKGDIKKLPASFQARVQPEHGTQNCLVEIPTGTKLCTPSDYVLEAPDSSLMVLNEEQFSALLKQTKNG